MNEDEENKIPEENENQDQENQGFDDIQTSGHHFYENNDNPEDTITKVTGMFKDWFLDYASYVIFGACGSSD